MTDDQERIIDSFLDEVVGGQQPPDFAPEILRKLHDAPPVQTEHLTQGVFDQPSTNRLAHATVKPPPQANQYSRRLRKQSSWLAYTVIAALAFVGLVVGLLASYLSKDQSNPPVVDNNKVESKDGLNKQNDGQFAETPKTDQSLKNKPGDEKSLVPDNSLVNQNPERFNSNDNDPPSDKNEPKFKLPDIDPMPTEELVASIDTSLNGIWNEHHVSATKSVSESRWAQRVIFALTGRDATEKEIERFDRISKQDRRLVFLDQLFEADEILDEFANLWARKLATAFLGEPVLSEHQYANKFPAKAHLLAHFRYALYHNTPYDEAATSLLTASGTIQPLEEDYDGASSYLILLQQQSKQDVAVATGKIGRSFLGQRMQCAQCHDDQAAGLAQQDFWRINVLLRDFRVTNQNQDLRIVQKPVSTDPVFFEDSSGVVRAVRTPLPSDGKTSTREMLADKIVHNPRFRQNAVNLVWSELLGYGLVHPPADMGKHNESIDTQLLTQLGDQFAVQGYDIRKLIRWIVMSQAFDRQSGKASQEDRPELGGQALFTRYYNPRSEKQTSSAAQSLELLANAILNPKDEINASPRQEIIGKIAPSLGGVPDKIVQGTGTDFDGWAVSESYAKTLDLIAGSTMSNQQKIAHIYWLALSREPTRKELETCQKLLDAKAETQTQILQDIWWAITRGR